MNDDFVFNGETYVPEAQISQDVRAMCRYSTGSVDNYFIQKRMIFWKSGGYRFYTLTNL